MIKPILQRTAAFVIGLITLAACDGEPVAPLRSSARTQNIIYRDAKTVPFSFVVYASCVNGGEGEVLQVNGDLTYSGHWITNTEGEQQHNAERATFAGTGTGWDTGDVYDVVTREFTQSNTAYGPDGIPDNGEQLRRVRLRAVQRVTGAVFELVLEGRFVQAANGEFVLSGWDGKARCE
jgi:hypothetical protein